MRRPAVVLVALLLLLLTACGRMPWDPNPDPTFQQLAAGLTSGDLAGTPGAENATPELTEVLSGMDGLKPTVTAHDTRIDGSSATSTLDVTWHLPGGEWRYQSTAKATLVEGSWQIDWAPATIHPELTPDTRLVHRADFPDRGRILTSDGTPVPTGQGFAPAVIGVVGPAAPEDVQAAGGAVAPEQPVGKSGLQRRYDEQLRGRPGSRVLLTARTSAANPVPDRELFRSDPVNGTDLTITLNESMQTRAEQALAGVGPAASIVAVRPSTGEILALANSPGSQGQPDANFGRYPPGSTFKVVTALALLRSGLTADAMLTCNENTTVNGRQFKNYSEFPEARLGELSLADAVAYSCNTALIAQHGRINADQLRSAAQSLGLGADYDAGFPAFYGEVGTPPNVVGLAESMIGQGTVLASPMAMAGVASSVEAGHTVVPYLVAGHKPVPAAQPLTPDEARQLQSMMQAVVSKGTGTVLRGVADGAKTGTAEYGTETPLRTHAWMIAYGNDLAVAAFVKDGESGSQTAGPLVAAVMR